MRTGLALWVSGLFLASCSASEPSVKEAQDSGTPLEISKAEEASPEPSTSGDQTKAPIPKETPPGEIVDALPSPPRLVILPPEPEAPAEAQPVTPPEPTPPVKDNVSIAEDRNGKPGRMLPSAIRDLMEAICDNDMEESARRLKKIPARGLSKQDSLLAELLTSYVQWRVGEDDKAEAILFRAHAELKESRGLKIAKALLVEPKTMSFGVYAPHEDRRYTLSDTLWLYMEPENVRQEETPEGRRLSLAVDFTLRDSRGNSVHDMERVRGREFEQICNDGLKNKISRNQRHDLWYYFKIALPANINPGDYNLEIRMADLVADPSKWAKTQVAFTVQ